MQAATQRLSEPRSAGQILAKNPLVKRLLTKFPPHGNLIAMDTKFKFNQERSDELLAEGRSSPGIRELIINSFKTLQELGIIVKVEEAQRSVSEPAASAPLPT